VRGERSLQDRFVMAGILPFAMGWDKRPASPGNQTSAWANCELYSAA
jgi:hypothetical protein